MDKLIDPDLSKALKNIIETASSIILTGHVRPDGDAVGSTLGLASVLKKFGKEVHVILPDKPPGNLSFLEGFKELCIYTSHQDYCDKLIDRADLIICCDFNAIYRQDNLAPSIQKADCKKVLIDHHEEPEYFADLTISYPDMSSTCELMFRLIANMGFYADLDLDGATALLTGIITDTRNFTVNCKHPDLYEILMRLLEKGVNKERIIHDTLLTRSYNSLKLEAFSISKKLEVFPKHFAALITLSKEDLEQYHYERGDAEGLVNRPLEIQGMIYSIFMREDPDCIKVSARSCRNFPVSEICKELFNGGGHRQAAGGEFKGSLDECRKRLLDNMNKFDKYLPKECIGKELKL